MTNKEILEQVPAYFQGYVAKIDAESVHEALGMTFERVLETFSELYDEQSGFAYAEGKWTIAELFGHLIDSERVFAYRALRWSRGDKMDLYGFDQDQYIQEGNFDEREFAGIKEEFKAVMDGTGWLYDGFAAPQLTIVGKASGVEMSVEALGYVIAGHRQHHLNILKERYLSKDN